MPALTIVLDVEKDGFSALRAASAQGHDARESIAAGKLVHLGEGAQIEVGALAGGMESGAPSAAFCFSLPDGRAVLAETSLALFLTAGDALKARYGDPRGHAPLGQEMADAQAESDAAMAAQASQGSTRQGVFEAGIRAALDHAISGLPRDLRELQEVLGEDLDAATFLIAGLVTNLTLQGINATTSAALVKPLLREYMAKAREACDG